MDMWQAYETSTETNAPNALIVHDRFHISKYLNEAVDKVRRAEHRELQQTGDDRLKGMRQTLLFNPENLSDEKNDELAALRKSTLATGRAWSIKELFRFFWQETDAVGGRAFFDSWYAWASRSRLTPIKKVARMLKNRLDRILSWFLSPISNGASQKRCELLYSQNYQRRSGGDEQENHVNQTPCRRLQKPREFQNGDLLLLRRSEP